MSTPQSSGPYRSRTDENNSNDASKQESHDRAIHKNIPGAPRKRKHVNQVNQNSQDTVTLNPSDSDSYLSEDSTCQGKDSEEPLSKYSKVDSDVQAEGDQENPYKDILSSVQEDFGPPIDTKLAGVLDSATSRDKGAQRKQRLLDKSTIPLIKAVVSLKGLEHDAEDKIPRDIKKKLQDVSLLLHKSLRLNNTIFTEIKEKEKVTIANL